MNTIYYLISYLRIIPRKTAIAAYNYYYGKELFDVHQFEKDLTIFNNLTGTNNLIVSV